MLRLEYAKLYCYLSTFIYKVYIFIPEGIGIDNTCVIQLWGRNSISKENINN